MFIINDKLNTDSQAKVQSIENTYKSETAVLIIRSTLW